MCKAGTWYLVARRDGELRTYKVSRVKELTVLDEQFARPDGFDLAVFWTESVAEYEATVPSVRVVVDVHAAAAASLAEPMPEAAGAVVHQEPLGDGRIRCELAFDNLDDAFLDLVRLGPTVMVREPVALAERLLASRARRGRDVRRDRFSSRRRRGGAGSCRRLRRSRRGGGRSRPGRDPT